VRTDKKEDHLIVRFYLGTIRTVVVTFLPKAAAYTLLAHRIDNAKVPGNACTSLAPEIYRFLRQQFGIVIRVLKDMIDSVLYLPGKTGISLQVSPELLEKQWFIHY